MKCVKCGSTNVATYLRGMPVFSDELQKEIERGKIILGECKISEYQPKYRCNKCKKDFAFPPIKIHQNEFVNYLLNTTYVEFSYGGYFEGCHTIIIEKDEENHCYISSSHFMKSEKKELSLKQFENILKTLYQRAYVLEWKRRYVDYDILDGTQWELKIKCKGVRQLNIYGSNQYPPLFNTVKNLFEKFFVYETFDY